MPTDWIAVSGVITNIATALDLGYRYTPHEKIVGKNAGDILKDVDNILHSTSVVLENHKDLLPPKEYNELKGIYHWQMTDESQQDRAATDEIIRQSRILSQLYANRESHQDRAKTLLYNVEVYQTTVLAASRKVVPLQSLAFEDSTPSSAASQSNSQQQPSASSSYTSWFSAFGRSSRGSTSSKDLEAGASLANASTAAEGQGFIVSVTHFPRVSSTSVDVGSGEIEKNVIGTGSTIYRRMILFENDEKRIQIIDPRLYALNKGDAFVSENSLRAMSELGESLLSQSDSGIPKGSQMAEYPDAPSLETTIDKFGKLSTESS
ncbi:hypothetical protein BDV93DRAFT_566662 [Ceratobasidium sp. AG-I]|nr:hypothetical protein BDV93DRAFT_566662 [Ceratobasidium sp. AG-I]